MKTSAAVTEIKSCTINAMTANINMNKPLTYSDMTFLLNIMANANNESTVNKAKTNGIKASEVTKIYPLIKP